MGLHPLRLRFASQARCSRLVFICGKTDQHQRVSDTTIDFVVAVTRATYKYSPRLVFIPAKIQISYRLAHKGNRDLCNKETAR